MASDDIPTQAGQTVLHLAAQAGHVDTVAALLDRGCDSNVLDSVSSERERRDESQIYFPPQVGRSSLQLAAAGGHLEIVKLLLNAGAAVDHQDELDRNTALHLASEHGYSQALSLLCSSRANVYMKNRAGFGALHVACQNGHNQSCRELLTSGCRPDIKNNVRLGHRRRTLVTCVIVSVRGHSATHLRQVRTRWRHQDPHQRQV